MITLYGEKNLPESAQKGITTDLNKHTQNCKRPHQSNRYKKKISMSNRIFHKILEYFY